MKHTLTLLVFVILTSFITMSNAYARITYTTCNDCGIAQQGLAATQIPMLNNNDRVFVFNYINRTVNEFKIIQREGEEHPDTNIPRIFNVSELQPKTAATIELERAYENAIIQLGSNGENLYNSAEELPDNFIIPSAADIVMNPAVTVTIADYINQYLNRQTTINRTLSLLEIQARNLNLSIGSFSHILPSSNTFYVKFPDGTLSRVNISLVKIGTNFEVKITYDGASVFADGTPIPQSTHQFKNLMQSATKIYLPSLIQLGASLGVPISFSGSQTCEPTEMVCDDNIRCTVSTVCN